MSTMIQRFPKPSQVKAFKQPVTIHPCGREVCVNTRAGKAEYKRRIKAMWERQRGMCGLMISPGCHKEIYLHEATFEHVDGRGMHGSKRDDRIEKDGKPYNLAACYECNALKGSRRIQ